MSPSMPRAASDGSTSRAAVSVKCVVGSVGIVAVVVDGHGLSVTAGVAEGVGDGEDEGLGEAAPAPEALEDGEDVASGEGLGEDAGVAQGVVPLPVPVPVP